MDLPTCPACGQSVIDDDAENCPFCGASMSGKPTARKPAPKAPAAKPQQPPKAAAAPTKAPQKPAAQPAAPKEDDPFAVDRGVPGKAIPASPRRTKDRPFQVVCPMCETVGYVPLTASEQEVRCPNKECLVPLFQAPKLEEPKEEAPPEEPEKGMSMMVFSLGAVALVLLVGTGIWYFVLREEPTKPNPFAGTQPPPRMNQGNNPEDEDPENNPEEQPQENPGAQQPVAQEVPLEQWQASALRQMNDVSFAPMDKHILAICRRLTTEAYIRAGDLETAKGQLEGLQIVGRDYPYYQVKPLVMFAWLHLEAGRQDEANQAIEQAVARAGQMRGSTYSVDAGTRLAALLVYVGRNDDAERILTQVKDVDDRGQLSLLQQLQQASGEFNFAQAVRRAPLLKSGVPQRMGVTADLCGRGHWDQAQQFAAATPSQEGKFDCYSVWAQLYARQHLADPAKAPIEKLNALIETLPSEGKARISAAAAQSFLNGGNEQLARTYLQQAETIAGAWTAPTAPVLPSEPREVFSLSTPDPEPLQLKALAQAEIAHTHDLLKEAGPAWDWLSKSLQTLQGIGPAKTQVDQRVKEASSFTAVLEQDLKNTYDLKTNDQVRLKLGEFREKLRGLQRSAALRFQLQTDLLSSTAAWSIREKIWQEINTRSQGGDPAQQEAFLTTGLPLDFLRAFLNNNNSAMAQQVQGVVSQQKLDDKQKLEFEVLQALQANQLRDAAQKVEQQRAIDYSWRIRLVVQLASQMVESGNLDRAWDFARSFSDPVFSEEILQAITAQAARNGQLKAAWSKLDGSKLQPTLYVASGYGFIFGSEALPAPEVPQP